MSGLAHKLLSKEELLDNELRNRVMEHLYANPGSYLGKISRELTIPTSTLKYHLNILRSFEMVTTVKKGRCRHYFPRRRRFSDEEKAMYAAIEHEPTRRMVEVVHLHPGISQAGLVRTTGLSQSTVAWHMAKLEEVGLVQSERNEVKEYHLVPQFATVFQEFMRRRAELEAEDAGAPVAPEADLAAPEAPPEALPAEAPAPSPLVPPASEAPETPVFAGAEGSSGP